MGGCVSNIKKEGGSKGVIPLFVLLHMIKNSIFRSLSDCFSGMSGLYRRKRKRKGKGN